MQRHSSATQSEARYAKPGEEGNEGLSQGAYFCRRDALLQTVEEGRDTNLMQINSASGRCAIVEKTGTNAHTSEVSTSWTGLFSSPVVATVGLVMPRLTLPFVGPPFSTVAVESPSDMVGNRTRATRGRGKKKRKFRVRACRGMQRRRGGGGSGDVVEKEDISCPIKKSGKHYVPSSFCPVSESGAGHSLSRSSIRTLAQRK